MKTILQLIVAAVLIVVAGVLWSLFRKPLPPAPPIADEQEWSKYNSVPSTITIANNGETLTATDTSRLFIDLTGSPYNIEDLKTESRGATFGLISNFSDGSTWPFYGEADLASADARTGEVDIMVKSSNSLDPDFKVTLLVHQY